MAKVDWNAIRTEYIAGGISQSDIAEKYGVTYAAVIKHAREEKWTSDRERVKKESTEKVIVKTAEAVSNSAVIAEKLRDKLLKRLEREIDALPDNIGTNLHKGSTELEYGKDGKSRKPTRTKEAYLDYKLRDLTAAWRDLTDGLPLERNVSNELLDSLMELEKSHD